MSQNTYLLLSQTKSKQPQDKTLPQTTTGVRRLEALSDQYFSNQY